MESELTLEVNWHVRMFGSSSQLSFIVSLPFIGHLQHSNITINTYECCLIDCRNQTQHSDEPSFMQGGSTQCLQVKKKVKQDRSETEMQSTAGPCAQVLQCVCCDVCLCVCCVLLCGCVV